MFGYLCLVDSCWVDNDVYGYINNVMYYSYFDFIINCYLIDKGGLDIYNGDVIVYVVSFGCDYFEVVVYLDVFIIGMCVDKLGNSLVCYGLVLFGEIGVVKVLGFVVYVFVDWESGCLVLILVLLCEVLVMI